jgi:hypothetical protein
VTLARDFTVTRNAVINGNTTLGDASGDSVTFNAATWTIANNITATRAIGVVGGTTFGATWNTTGQVDASGTATIIGQNFSFTHSGANNGDSIRAFRTTTDHQGSGTLGEIHGMNVTGTVSGTGNVTHYYGSLSQLQLTNSANVSNALYFYAVAPVLSSTGAVTEMDGFFSGNLGHASLVTSAWGFNASDITASLSNVAGFRSQVNSGTNKWGLYFDGTADNALNGKLRIGSTTAPTVALDVTGSAAISSDLTLPAAPSDPILLASIFGR